VEGGGAGGLSWKSREEASTCGVSQVSGEGGGPGGRFGGERPYSEYLEGLRKKVPLIIGRRGEKPSRGYGQRAGGGEIKKKTKAPRSN